LEQPHILRGLGYGALLILWLTLEDKSLILVSLLGLGLSFTLVYLGLLRFFGGRSLAWVQALPVFIILGGVVGFGAVVATISLMVFKNTWHGHLVPDFSTSLIVGIGQRTPEWTLAGALVGSAYGFWRLALNARL
jgi:hypothetical protein